MGVIRSSSTILWWNTKSSAVKGAPSDHLIPSRSLAVQTVPLSLPSTEAATAGTREKPSVEKRSSPVRIGLP